MKKEQRMRAFCAAIWDWYAVHKRDLPWRRLDYLPDPDRAYRVLVSEIMLQQTQVPRVTILYPIFLERFPSVHDLARASNRDVIMAWKGLGYNNRALRLRDAAKAITDRHGGVCPQVFEELRALPGIGPYTAAAVRNFAFNEPTPCIDVNIERIFLRVFFPPSVKNLAAGALHDLAAEILGIALDDAPGHDAREWHSALMDFGSLVCTKKNPAYDACPLMAAGLYADPQKDVGVKRTKTEPSRHGTPNRIYRGRIIEELRKAKAGMPADRLGPAICDAWTTSPDDPWLESLIAALIKDALIVRRDGKVMLAD